MKAERKLRQLYLDVADKIDELLRLHGFEPLYLREKIIIEGLLMVALGAFVKKRGAK